MTVRLSGTVKAVVSEAAVYEIKKPITPPVKPPENTE